MTPLTKLRCLLWRVRWPLVVLAAAICVGEGLAVVFGPAPILSSGPALPVASSQLEAGTILTERVLTTPGRRTLDKNSGVNADSGVNAAVAEVAASIQLIGKRLTVPVNQGDLITPSMVSEVPHKLSPSEGLVTVSLPASNRSLAQPGAVVQVMHTASKNAIPTARASMPGQLAPILVLSERAVIVSILDAGSKKAPSWSNASGNQVQVLLRASITEAKQIATAAQVSPISVIFVT